MLRLKVFGAPTVERDERPLEGSARQRRVLGLLTLIAAARDRGVSRDTVLASLWSESDPEKARQALAQGLYHARRALQQDDLWLGAADLRLNPEVISSDLWDFDDALERGDYERAAQLHDASFLDGFYVNDAPEFERWVSAERARLAQRCAAALEELARRATYAADFQGAVRWCRRRASLDPLNSTAALALIRALAAAGDRAGAIQHARVHEALLKQELDVALEPEIVSLVNQLRAEAVRERDPSPRPILASEGQTSTLAADAVPASPPQSRIGWPRRMRYLSAVAAGLLAVAATVSMVRHLSTIALRSVRNSSGLIAIAPFRVSGADRSLVFLGEGLVDLLVTKLADDGTSRAAGAGPMIATWHRAGVGARGATSRDVALTTARQMGASRVLFGNVVGTPSHLVVSASLLDVNNGALRAQATVEGPFDSLTAIVDHLVVRLIAREAGVSNRLANHTSTSLRALRAFLDGQAAYRRGSYRNAFDDFHRTLDVDSTFAMAGLGLAQAADRLNARADFGRGLDVAWRYRNKLVEPDRVYLEALAGPRYPAATGERQRLAAWERATVVTPDRADVWLGLGKELFFAGRMLGIRDADERATVAFRRALAFDDGFASPLQFLLQLAAARGDTAEVRRTELSYMRLDSTGDLAGFVRWRSAVALHDTSARYTIRRSFAAMPAVSLRQIALSSMYQGIAGRDIDRALAALSTRAARAADRVDLLLAEHALALNRGEPTRALRLVDAIDGAQPLSPQPDRLRVLDALYGGADSAVGARSAGRIAGRVSLDGAADIRGISRNSVGDTAASSDRCALGQWYAWHGNHEAAGRAVVGLTGARPDTGDGFSVVCAALIEGVVATQGHAADANTRLARLDSLLLNAPPAGSLYSYANFALARLYAQEGDRRRALAAARRAPYMEAWPPYLTGQLREVGRLAATLGDTATAVRAFRRFLALRTGPHSEIRRDVEEVRTELKQLAGGS